MRPGPWSAVTALQRAALGLALAFFLLPLLYLVAVSLSTQSDLLSGRFFPSDLAWSNWPAAYRAVPILRFLRNSLVAATGSVLVTLLIAIPGTYAIARAGVGGKALPTAVLSSYVAPPVVAVFPLFYLLRWVGLLDTLVGLALVLGLANVPVAVWLLDGFIRRLTPEIEEAARVDGCGWGSTLLRIVVPLISPGIAATGIICFILSYNEFLLPLILTSSTDAQTLTVGISLFQGDRLVNFGQMAAASLTGMVPVYVLALLFQRWLVGGLTKGAIR